MYRLGVMRRWDQSLLSKSAAMGYISDEDFPTYFKELEELARKGNPEAQYQTGCILLHGKTEDDGYHMWEIEPDEEAAQMWLRKAAAQGYDKKITEVERRQRQELQVSVNEDCDEII